MITEYHEKNLKAGETRYKMHLPSEIFDDPVFRRPAKEFLEHLKSGTMDLLREKVNMEEKQALAQSRLVTWNYEHSFEPNVPFHRDYLQHGMMDTPQFPLDTPQFHMPARISPQRLLRPLSPHTGRTPPMNLPQPNPFPYVHPRSIPPQQRRYLPQEHYLLPPHEESTLSDNFMPPQQKHILSTPVMNNETGYRPNTWRNAKPHPYRNGDQQGFNYRRPRRFKQFRGRFKNY